MIILSIFFLPFDQVALFLQVTQEVQVLPGVPDDRQIPPFQPSLSDPESTAELMSAKSVQQQKMSMGTLERRIIQDIFQTMNVPLFIKYIQTHIILDSSHL